MPTLAPSSTAEEIDDLLAHAAAAAAERRRQQRARRKKIIAAAVIGSVLLHLLLAPLLMWGVSHWPRKPLKPGTTPFQLTIVRTPEEEEQKNSAANAQRNPDYIRTTDEQQADKPPEKEDFISDKDTLAAADQPADASKPPLPSQQGKEIPTFDFDTTPYRPGKDASNAATAASQPAQQNTSTPNQTPQPDRQSKVPDSKTKTSPKTAAAPTPTPDPTGELAMLKAQPTPVNEPPHPDETPSDTPPPPAARSSANAPSRSVPSTVTSPGLVKPPAYQPQTTQAKLTGSINNRGRPAPAARMTPLGKYQKAVQDAIGSMWYMEIERQMSNIVSSSEVRMHFFVTRSGQVRALRVSGGQANSVLATVTFGAVSEAEIAPIPPDVAELLPGGELEVDLGFDLYMQ